MKKYLSCDEIYANWGLKKIELFEYIKKGLQPYSKNTGKPVPCPYTLQKELKGIKYRLKVTDNYLKAPEKVTPKDGEWLYDQHMSIKELRKSLKLDVQVFG